MNQMTESAIVGELKEILYNKDHIDVIDALRPNGTFTLDVSDEKLTDLFIEANRRFEDYVRQAIFDNLQEKKQDIDLSHPYR